MTKVKQNQLNRAENQVNNGTIPKAVSCHIAFFMVKTTKWKGDSTIHARLTTGKKNAASMSTGIQAPFESYDPATNSIKDQPLKTASLNKYRAEIERVFFERQITDRELSPKTILQIAFGQREHDINAPAVLVGIERFMASKRELLGNGITLSTLKRYEQYQRILTEFFADKYSKEVRFDEIKRATANELITFCMATKNHGRGYAVKITDFMKGILIYAFANEWSSRNAFDGIRLKKHYREVVTLTEKQIQAMLDYDFDSVALSNVRYHFVFCCFTGLSYSDIKQLNKSHLHRHEDGAFYLEKPRQKTNVNQFIPLIDPAVAILDLYKNDPCRKFGLLLPVISNQQMNQHLKDVGALVGIPEKLHSHLGRKTCTNLFVKNGVPLATTCKVLGFTPEVAHRHYLKIQPETAIEQVNEALQGKFTVTKFNNTKTA